MTVDPYALAGWLLSTLLVGVAVGRRLSFREGLQMVQAAVRTGVQEAVVSLRPPPLPPEHRAVRELLTGPQKAALRTVQLGGLSESEDAVRRAAMHLCAHCEHASRHHTHGADGHPCDYAGCFCPGFKPV